MVTGFPQDDTGLLAALVAGTRRVTIGGELFDLADEKVSIDTSESAARMVLAGRGIYTACRL